MDGFAFRINPGVWCLRLCLLPLLSIFACNLSSGVGLAAEASGSLSGNQTAVQNLPSVPFEKIKLKNGLEVIFSENHRLPRVCCNLWYHVGPANELPGRTGFAHLFEHMMFEGSKHVGPKSHFKYLEAAGASPVNGSTNFDRTNYHETLPSNQLELALWLESDRMGYLLEQLDEEKLTNQKDVVRNERRQGENSPYSVVREAMYHELFPKGHPYYASVIGSHRDIEAAQFDDVREFFRQYYTPNNATLAIVGDFDKAAAKSLVEKYFGSIPAGPAVRKIDVVTPSITSRRAITVEDQVELPRIYISWLTAPIYQPGDVEAKLAAHILGGGKSSRLYKKLVYEKQIAQDVSASNQGMTLGSVFTVSVTAKPKVELAEIEKIVNQELAEFRKNGPTQEELEGARNSNEFGLISSLENISTIADQLNQYNHYLGDPGYLPRDFMRYENATANSIREFAEKYLTADSCVVVSGVPGKKVLDDVPRRPGQGKGLAKAEQKLAQSEKAEDDWRAKPPAPGPEPKVSLPIPQSFKLANGLKVLLVERHELPVVAAGLTTLGGSLLNPPASPGLANFTYDMLDEGTARRSTLEIARQIDRNGLRISASAGRDAASVRLSTLTKTADFGFDIFSDIVLHPAFDAKEIERLRNHIVNSITRQKDSPGTIARLTLLRELYGSEGAMGYDELGTIASIKATTREQMVDFWQKTCKPDQAVLVLSGDLTREQAGALAEKYFGGWQGTASLPALPKERPAGERHIYIVNKEGAPQTVITTGLLAIARNSPDFAATRILNTAIGGMFSSRLNMNLREKHGYTYGAHSNFTCYRSPGPFNVSTDVRTDVTGPAVSEIFKELQAISGDKPITEVEVKMSKDNNILSLPAGFESNYSTAISLAELFVYDLPLDYYNKLPALYEKQSAADVQRVAHKYVKPENMAVCLVGDQQKIEPQIKALNLGSITELDFECNPVK